MKILQTSIERLLYLNLLLVFIIAAAFSFAFARQQNTLHNQSTAILQTIKENQAAQTEATKIYIDCLLKINPQGNIRIQEQVCFDKAPTVRP